jgi:DNA-binding NtrC family response regulator
MNVIGFIASESAERAELAAFLNECGRQMIVSDAADASIAALVSRGVEAFIFDLAAPNALKLLRQHAAQWRRLPVICLADRRRPNSGAEALRLGAADVVTRPLRIEDLQAALVNVAALTEHVPDDTEEAPALDGLDHGVFGTSPAMQEVLGLVHRVATSSCSVLIVGERGTGREMVARAIHVRGSRRNGRFVRISCDAVDEADLSRAISDAAGGQTTLYLEDVANLRGETPRLLHAWLRRHSDEETAAPGDADRVRLIGGAQPQLFNRADKGAIPRDLVDALAVVRIDLPPLRHRPQDIPPLAVHFLKEACRQAQLPAKTFSRGAVRLLAALPWRRNAAELKSLCERLTVVVPRGVVLLEDVLANVRFDTAEAVAPLEETLRQARDRFERDYIVAVVEQHRGRMGAAARQLGIERTNLYRKLRQLHILASRS